MTPGSLSWQSKTVVKELYVSYANDTMSLGKQLFILSLLSGIFAVQACNRNDESVGLRIACVGNSITYGHGIRDRENGSYPAQLQKLLGTTYTVRNFGVSGSTMLKQGDRPYWDEPEFQNATDFNADIIVIKLGTNDLKPHNWQHADQFIDDYLAMIDHFRNQPGRPAIYICYQAPIFWGGATTWSLSKLHRKIDKISKRSGATIIDLYTPLKDHPEHFSDGVHPNAKGAFIIANAVHTSLLKPE